MYSVTIFLNNKKNCDEHHGRSKELYKVFRKKIVAAYKLRKWFNKVRREFQISHSNVGKNIYKNRMNRKTANLSKSGHPSKFKCKVRAMILRAASKNPKMYSVGYNWPLLTWKLSGSDVSMMRNRPRRRRGNKVQNDFNGETSTNKLRTLMIWQEIRLTPDLK